MINDKDIKDDERERILFSTYNLSEWLKKNEIGEEFFPQKWNSLSQPALRSALDTVIKNIRVVHAGKQRKKPTKFNCPS